MNPTPQTARAFEVKEKGRIVYDVFDEGLRFIIVRGPASFCAYVGIPKDHPLAGFSYDDLIGISAHGGLTYAGKGVKGSPDGYYWYGWDYAHLGDVTVCDHTYQSLSVGEHDWTIEEIVKDSQDTLSDFRKLVKITEKIKAKPTTPLDEK